MRSYKSGYMLKIKSADLLNEMDRGCEEERWKLTPRILAWVTGRVELSSTEMGKAGRGANFQEKIKRSILNQRRSNKHHSTQTVVLKYHFPGLLIPGLGQEMHEMTPEAPDRKMLSKTTGILSQGLSRLGRVETSEHHQGLNCNVLKHHQRYLNPWVYDDIY